MSANVSLVGRLTRDAEMKVIGKNNALSFSVAADSGYGDKKTTTFYNCTYFRNADGLAPYMLKGTQVFVAGEFSMRTWTNKEGKEISSPAITVSLVDLVGSKTSGEGAAPAAAAPARKPAAPRAAPADVPGDEDVPF